MSTNDIYQQDAALMEDYNAYRNLLIQQYNDRGVLKKEIRSYEVSLWTLQDEFITVLKWSDAEQIGRIEKPKMTLNVDGTEKFEFSIPMYYRIEGVLVENPNWYTVHNLDLYNGKESKNLMTSMRKIKVIFNKDISELKQVFEFVILVIISQSDSVTAFKTQPTIPFFCARANTSEKDSCCTADVTADIAASVGSATVTGGTVT